MKIYFTRHGESEANILHIISNRHLPHALTEKGCGQAAALAEKLAGKKITRIFCSPVPRAIETGKIVAEALTIPLQITDALREYDCGELEGRGDAQAWSLHRQFWTDWLAGLQRDQSPQDGETFYNIQRRFVTFIDDLIREFGSTDENLLLISHGGTYTFGLPHVLANVGFELISSLPFEYTIIITAEVRAGKLVCLQWGDTPLSD